VISGEHGIGITNSRFLSDDELRDFADYKARVDPKAASIKGKACLRGAGAHVIGRRRRAADLGTPYTPSFGADGPRALIHAAKRHPAAISDSIKDCLPLRASASRVARRTCRVPICCTKPAQQDLATSLLIRGLSLEEQTRRGISLRHWEEFRKTSGDHCTVCPQVREPVPGEDRLRATSR